MRAHRPSPLYWFSRPRLVDRLPLPCPPSCLHSPVGTFPAHAHSGDRAPSSPDDLLSFLLWVSGLANTRLLHSSDSRHGPNDARHPVVQCHRNHLPRLLVQHPPKPRIGDLPSSHQRPSIFALPRSAPASSRSSPASRHHHQRPNTPRPSFAKGRPAAGLPAMTSRSSGSRRR